MEREGEKRRSRGWISGGARLDVDVMGSRDLPLRQDSVEFSSGKGKVLERRIGRDYRFALL